MRSELEKTKRSSTMYRFPLMTVHFIPTQASEVIGIDLKQTNEQDNYQRLLAESSP